MLFDPTNLILCPWAVARTNVWGLRNGDLLQYRVKGVLGRLIAFGTFASHSHSARAVVLPNEFPEPMVVDTTLAHGCAVRSLRDDVLKLPGLIDVFRPDRKHYPEYDPDLAVAYIREHFVGHRYGIGGLLKLSAQRAALIRWLWYLKPAEHRDTANGSPPFCSHLQSTADRCGGGVDPVPNTPDSRVTPGQLTQSLLWGGGYQFTLIP